MSDEIRVCLVNQVLRVGLAALFVLSHDNVGRNATHLDQAEMYIALDVISGILNGQMSI